MPQKYILPHLPNAIFPPDEHALYKDNLPISSFGVDCQIHFPRNRILFFKANVM